LLHPIYSLLHRLQFLFFFKRPPFLLKRFDFKLELLVQFSQHNVLARSKAHLIDAVAQRRYGRDKPRQTNFKLHSTFIDISHPAAHSFLGMANLLKEKSLQSSFDSINLNFNARAAFRCPDRILPIQL
jgi:hypothetical protein